MVLCSDVIIAARDREGKASARGNLLSLPYFRELHDRIWDRMMACYSGGLF